MNQKIHIFTFFQYVTSAINSIKGFIFVIFLSPEAFGIWRTFYTTINYARYFDLGISTFSYYRGLIKDFKKSYINLIWRSVYVLIIPSSICFSLVAYKYFNIFDMNIILMAILIFFLSFAVQFYASMASIFKINRNIKNLIIMDISLASISLFLSSLLGVIYGLNGILWGMTISYLLIFIYLCIYEKEGLSMQVAAKNYLVRNKRFITIIPNSFTYYLPGAVSVMFINVDLWFGANAVSSEIAGFFGLFMGFQILVSIAPSSISTWFYIDDAKGINNDLSKLLKVCSINFFASLTVALIGLGLSYLLISIFLDKYMQTYIFIEAIFWTLPFFALRNILVNIIIIRNLSLIFSSIVLILILIKVYLFSIDSLDLYSFINIVRSFNIIFTVAIFLILFFSKITNVRNYSKL